MRILHLTNDFSGSTVYKNLISELDGLAFSQVVYNPVREISRINKNKIDFKNEDSEIIYSNILNNFSDRLFYPIKITKILKDIEDKVDLKKINLIHAHTWYSDGGVAYEINKKYNIPYVVAIRTTDINIFYKYLFFLRPYGIEILKNASKIIFISKVIEKQFHVLLSNRFFGESIVIPNGIDKFWIVNSRSKQIKKGFDFNLLYIGSFIKRKNIMAMLQAVELVRKDGYNCRLTLVGGSGSEEASILKFIKKKSYFEYLGKISDKENLLQVFRKSDVFLMASKVETFGLVYFEAISQGLPVIYSENDGIDGFYNGIGEAVNANEVKAISKGIIKVINNYSNYSLDQDNILMNHNWSNIASTYHEIYKKAYILR
ncbi:glycosyltransferase family 4 protein [Flavobacterium sp. LAR06]|uniref:glycosyltransferase family 4 protein n=1 Tax=Flavobacterium sp. LAR06 TaxID=3064897 RepID=UPI0035C0AB6A